MRKTSLLAVALILGTTMTSCSEPIPTSSTPTEGIRLESQGSAVFAAVGKPLFGSSGVVPSTFAVAMLDSTGGIVIAAFNKKDTGGDAFILQLTTARLGDHGPCNLEEPSAECHGRIIYNITANNTLDWDRWEIGSGKAVITDKTTRVVGTVDDLVLRRVAGGAAAQTISGEFNLPLLSGDEALRMMRCWIAEGDGKACS